MAPPNDKLSLGDLLPQAAVRIGLTATNWETAVRMAGEVLVDIGSVSAQYVDEMVTVVRELGPYIVITPGIALAHARPSSSVHRPALCWVTLSEPVAFGHPENDPVTVVVGLAAPDDQSHITALSALAELLSEADRFQAMVSARTPQEVRAVIESFEHDRKVATG